MKSKLLNGLISNLIRTEMKVEEDRPKLIKLIVGYSDIFYGEGKNLTFTNQVRHRIKTKGEINTYTKNCFHLFINKKFKINFKIY